MTVTLGFDVEEFDFPLERGRGIDFGTQLAVSSEGLEFLLDLLARLELRATFYTTANFALHRTDLVRRIVAGGHEVASHDYYHGLTAGSDPAGSRRTLEELTGQRIVGYRAPRLGRRFVRGARGGGVQVQFVDQSDVDSDALQQPPGPVLRVAGGGAHDLSGFGLRAFPRAAVLDFAPRHAAAALQTAVPQRPAPRRAPEPLFPSVGVFRTAARAGFRCSGLSYALFGDGPATEIHPAAGVAESPRLSVFDHPRIPRMR